VASVSTPTDCYSCRGNANLDSLPPRERIATDDQWRVAHAFGSAVPGWLVLLPRRHVTSIADLTRAEAASLGTWQVRLSQALHTVLGCQKTYVAQFAEAAGLAHVHFHIVPRAVDLADEFRGPRIFQLLGPSAPPHVGEVQMDEIAARLVSELAS
jgi:diadenosine tetraphosphate (Ap4A) HIT family hydrolase